MKKIILITYLLVFLSSCASIFISKNQKLKINTPSNYSKIYIDNILVKEGKTITEKVVKTGSKEIMVVTPGYKDKRVIIIPSKRPAIYWLVQPLNILNGFFPGLAIDAANTTNINYSKKINIETQYKLKNFDTTEKHLSISSIRIDIQDKYKDISFYDIEYGNGSEKELQTKITKALKNKSGDNIRPKNNITSTLINDEKSIAFKDYQYTDEIFQTLKKSGYVDTINKIFRDKNNILTLEGKINKVDFFRISNRYDAFTFEYAKLNLRMVWYFKNSYNQIIDSLEVNAISDDFRPNDNSEDIISDAILNSYLDIHENEKFKQLIKKESDFSIKKPELLVNDPKNIVKNPEEAMLASVIVKSKKGHGSGFAISEDGYIVTNFHVIAGEKIDQFDSVEIITSDGRKFNASIVRYNAYRDLALLKIDTVFEKSFKLNNQKTFKILEDIYTIGAPNSIELGQSISSGLISNERIVNNNHTLQLAMSVNPGNSGGPLFSETGNIHGVIVAKVISNNKEGIGFAIPGYLVQEYLNIKYK